MLILKLRLPLIEELSTGSEGLIWKDIIVKKWRNITLKIGSEQIIIKKFIYLK